MEQNLRGMNGEPGAARHARQRPPGLRQPVPEQGRHPPDRTAEEHGLLHGYTEDVRRERKLAVYAGLMLVYSATFAGFLLLTRARGQRLPKEVAPKELVFLGVATHRLARLVSRERITSPIRAPFTHYEGRGTGPNEVNEKARGGRVREAVGELLTCPWCAGVWTATFLAYGYTLWPRATRLVTTIFAADALSDFLHLGYSYAKKATR